MRFSRSFSPALGAIALAAALAARADESPIGKAASVIPAASYTRGTQVAALEVNDAVQQDDRVKTSAQGSTQIKFVDETLLTVGPASEVRLDKMIFDGGKAQNATLTLVRGAMRFTSGSSDHSAYHIQTQVATIGVRGTVIDVAYDDDKMIYRTVEGEAEVCNANAGCRTVRAGDPPLAITLRGFALATAAEVGRFFRTLDNVANVLTRQAQNVLRGTTQAVQGTVQGAGHVVQGVGNGVAQGIRRTLQFRPPF